MRSYKVHVPVMKQEVIEGLAVQPGGRYIDCTAGSGGHAGAILKYSSPGGQLLGIDADPSAADTARRRLAGYGSAVVIENDNFVNLEKVCAKYVYAGSRHFIEPRHSSMQLTDSGAVSVFNMPHRWICVSIPNRKLRRKISLTVLEADLAALSGTRGRTCGNRIARAIVNERAKHYHRTGKNVEQTGFKRAIHRLQGHSDENSCQQ